MIDKRIKSNKLLRMKLLENVVCAVSDADFIAALEAYCDLENPENDNYNKLIKAREQLNLELRGPDDEDFVTM